MTATEGLVRSNGAALDVRQTASVAVAEQARAIVEARWIVAMRAPRDLDMVRAELLRECQRPSFAVAARYRKPIGQGIEGLSIRFVEAALQAMRNVDTEAQTIYDDDEKRIVEVRVTDFERNVSHRKQLTIAKVVERRKLRRGQVPIAERTNSTGETVYVVQASDDDLATKEAALVSKAIRTCGLRLIPGWLQDECDRAIQQTVRAGAKKDPDAERRQLADAFGALGVTPSDLASYLGHDLGKVSPSQLVELRAVYQAIRDGETSWADTVRHAKGESDDDGQEQSVDPNPSAGLESWAHWESQLGECSSAAEFAKVAAQIDSLPSEYRDHAKADYTRVRKAVLDGGKKKR